MKPGPGINLPINSLPQGSVNCPNNVATWSEAELKLLAASTEGELAQATQLLRTQAAAARPAPFRVDHQSGAGAGKCSVSSSVHS